jgi:hypothetical protein
MSLIGATRFPERLQFFNGQRLFASDLQGLEQFNREMRWLHNQSLHQAGVASGYAISGKKDDREVTIQPGYALDSLGREIVLTQTVVEPVPPVANDGRGRPVYFDLVVSYPDDAQLKETETRDGICVSRSAVRLREAPVFCWVELSPTGDPPGPQALDTDRQAKLASLNTDVESGIRIRLARAEVLNCRLNQPLSLSQRKNARPSPQPYVAAGRSASAALWSSAVTGFGITISLDVDTSQAHFRSKPSYFANVIGKRDLELTMGGVKSTFILDGFPRLDLKAGGFKFSLLIPEILIDRKFKLEDVAKALPPALSALPPADKWYVEWIGVEG